MSVERVTEIEMNHSEVYWGYCYTNLLLYIDDFWKNE